MRTWPTLTLFIALLVIAASVSAISAEASRVYIFPGESHLILRTQQMNLTWECEYSCDEILINFTTITFTDQGENYSISCSAPSAGGINLSVQGWRPAATGGMVASFVVLNSPGISWINLTMRPSTEYRVYVNNAFLTSDASLSGQMAYNFTLTSGMMVDVVIPKASDGPGPVSPLPTPRVNIEPGISIILLAALAGIIAIMLMFIASRRKSGGRRRR